MFEYIYNIELMKNSIITSKVLMKSVKDYCKDVIDVDDKVLDIVFRLNYEEKRFERLYMRYSEFIDNILYNDLLVSFKKREGNIEEDGKVMYGLCELVKLYQDKIKNNNSRELEVYLIYVKRFLDKYDILNDIDYLINNCIYICKSKIEYFKKIKNWIKSDLEECKELLKDY